MSAEISNVTIPKLGVSKTENPKLKTSHATTSTGPNSSIKKFPTEPSTDDSTVEIPIRRLAPVNTSITKRLSTRSSLTTRSPKTSGFKPPMYKEDVPKPTTASSSIQKPSLFEVPAAKGVVRKSSVRKRSLPKATTTDTLIRKPSLLGVPAVQEVVRKSSSPEVLNTRRPTKKSSNLEKSNIRTLTRKSSIVKKLSIDELSRRLSIQDNSPAKRRIGKPPTPKSISALINFTGTALPTVPTSPIYHCTVMPSTCKESFSGVIPWIHHELSEDHIFLLGQTEWLCAYRATKELPLPLPRNDIRLHNGCDLAFNSPQGLLKHWKEKNEIGTATEFRIGKGCQRFWCGFCKIVHIVGCSGQFSWDKERVDHLRWHFEGEPGYPETRWKIEQWKEYTNADDADWMNLPSKDWKAF